MWLLQLLDRSVSTVALMTSCSGAGGTDRHRLSHIAKGVQIALFKAGQGTDYYHWLLFFPLISYLLPIPHPATPTSCQSDVSSKFCSFTLQYSQVSLHSPIVLFCIIPWSIKYCSHHPVPSSHSPKLFNQKFHAVTLLQFPLSRNFPPSLHNFNRPMNQLLESYWMTKPPSEAFHRPRYPNVQAVLVLAGVLNSDVGAEERTCNCR